MKAIYKQCLLAIMLLITGVCTFPALAHANEVCVALKDNPEWETGLSTLSHLIVEKNYEEANSLAIKLQNICPLSPVLNYMQARIAENTGDTKAAQMHFKKASEYIMEFAVPLDTAEKIWYARYEIEHPKKACDNALYDKTLMWTGAGVGIGGLAIAVTGLSLALTKGKNAYSSDPNTNKVKPNALFTVDWALFGAGLAFAVSGAVLTGIFGYRYTHSTPNETVSWTLTPQSTSLQITF